MRLCLRLAALAALVAPSGCAMMSAGPVAPGDIPWFDESHKAGGGNTFRRDWPLLSEGSTVSEGSPEGLGLLAGLQKIDRGMSAEELDRLLGGLQPTKVWGDSKWESRIYLRPLDSPVSASSPAAARSSSGLAFRVILWRGRWVAAVEELE